MPETAWKHLVVALMSCDEGFRCELRDGRALCFPPEWWRQISVTDRLHVADAVVAVDLSTALHLERDGRPDLAQIPISAAHPPKPNARGRGIVFLDAVGAQHGVERVLVTTRQIRDCFFAPDRSLAWTEQGNWFDILGVRESSTPAEIRIAYRVRGLELQAASPESIHKIQAQLARGLQILMDPGLRRDYLALLENPDHHVSFPTWMGCLLGVGEKRGNSFVVHDFVRFVTSKEKRRIQLALRRFRFEGPFAIYRDPRKRILIRFDATVLPLHWTEDWNAWAHLTLGSIPFEATFWQQTRFRRVAAGFQPTVWSQPFANTLSLPDVSSLAGRFENARAFWNRFHPHADVIALLRARIEQEPIESGKAAEWCLAHGVRAPVEARWINWEPDYQEAYYRELATRARAVYLFRNEYLFLFENTIISEIPQAGHASYIFHPPTSLETFLRGYARTTRHRMRSDSAGAKRTLGYCGRIAHPKELAVWIAKIERAFASPMTQRATT